MKGLPAILITAALLDALTLVGPGAQPSTAASDAAVDYKLPWEAGATFQVTQGNYASNAAGTCTSGCFTHEANSSEHYAWDFDLPEGTPLLASAGGKVAMVQDKWAADHCGSPYAIKNPPEGYVVSANIGNEANYVVIDHGDGTSALYLHLKEVAPGIRQKLQTGDRVEQGELLGLSGKTGMTQCGPHIHFQVQETGKSWYTKSRAITFSDADVVAKSTNGVPAQQESYTSDNRRREQAPATAIPSTAAIPDWRNFRFTLSCGGLAPKPFAVSIRNGTGGGPSDSKYPLGYMVEVEVVATGDLTGDNMPESAVLVACSGQPSNFWMYDVLVFTKGDRPLGTLPALKPLPTGNPILPQYEPKDLAVRAGRLVTGVRYYAKDDSHADAPSLHRILTWAWERGRFVQASSSAVPPVPLDQYPLTLEGIGPLRIGMSETEASAALDTKVRADYLPGTTCGYAHPLGEPSSLGLMFMDGALVRVEVEAPSRVATRSGIHIGSSEADVKRAYPKRITVRPHPYNPTGHYLVFTPASADDAKRLLIFETNGSEVTSFRAGQREAVELVESCV